MLTPPGNLIRKRGAHGRLSVVTTIPQEKAKVFVRGLTVAFPAIKVSARST